ncbi:calcium-binding protein [Paracoccus sp. T5]|uniref:calcium-binding protein n=1 Tax=Paracoccus sp. T5 TaxID=3402161 RepID=UPI003AE10CDD
MPLIDIVRLDENPHETVNGIRHDTTSRGVDLDGAKITASYSDGTTEILTWRALDTYTFGAASGTDIAMSFGSDWHELSTTKALASLQINLQPANSVFDTTLDGDDYPAGNSTPTSLIGYPFKLAPEYEETIGDLTVTYSGIVNLTGSLPAGDLYTVMVVDFSKLPEGGLLGDLRWNSDIDTMRDAGDLVSSSQGDDTLMGGAGDDILDGGHGTDTADYLRSQDGVRVDLSMTGAQWVSDSQGNDTLINIENLTGSRFNDTLTGSIGANLLAGDEGDDLLNGLAGNDTLLGGTGDDTLYGNLDDDLLEGGEGHDRMHGEAGNDQLFGSAGNDTLVGGSGNDIVDGGSGIDWVSFRGASLAARVDLSVTDPQDTGQGYDVIREIENIHGGTGDDTLLGSAQDNLIRGGTGADNIQGRQGSDLLEGNAGNDTLIGGLGNDTLDGGAGIDWVSFRGASRAARVDLSVTDPQATGHGFDVIRSIENIQGGTGDDILLGSGQANLLRGGTGADNIQGRRGSDLLEGNAGNDTLIGGLGNDTLDGGTGMDWVSFRGASRAVRVDLAMTDPQDTGHGFDVIRNIENIQGGAGNDVLLGNARSNQIRGGAGADNIQGRRGSDLLEGNAGNDTLIGSTGNDTLDGGTGADRLKGGADSDTFVFRHGYDRDVVLDFQDNIDTIRILDFGVETFAQASTYAAPSGANVVFDFGDGDILTIRNTTISALGNDLLFV